MEKTILCFLALILVRQRMIGVTGDLPRCGSNGFGGCECMFIGACDSNGNLRAGVNPTTMVGYAPTGLEIFSDHLGQAQRNLAFLCEYGKVAIMYDCNKRIPLYSVTLMETLYGQVDRSSWRYDTSLAREYQQWDSDYHRPQNHPGIELCYETNPKKRYIDIVWYNSINPKQIPANQSPPECDQIISGIKRMSIHKGHLVAASYGRGDPNLSAATFTYTNIVPQFQRFNTGQWMREEGRLTKWGRDFCEKHDGKPTKDCKLYIIVGTFPSTFSSGSARPRYFGKSGFSDYIGENYRINVPSKLWTAACCTFKFEQSDGSWQDGTRHTAFWRDNIPSSAPCDHAEDINALFSQFKSAIQLFPGHPACTHTSNYVALY